MESVSPINIVSPGAYVVCEETGDILPSEGQGLFYRDTRHLSEFLLTINGERPAISECRMRGDSAEALVVSGEADGMEVVRWRSVADGMREEILLVNLTDEPVEVRVRLVCGADFEDLFEVRGYARARGERGEFAEEVGEDYLSFSYWRGDFRRGTEVRVWGEGIGPRAERGSLLCDLEVGAGEERKIQVSVDLREGDERARGGQEPSKLYSRVPVLETGWEYLHEGWKRSVEDLRLLSFEVREGLSVPAAGAPWYMALFGRDAIITAYQTLVLDPEPARNVLRVLAGRQAEEHDDFRDAEPGKILHELRSGELAHFGEVPHSPYYGTADATPLFLILLEELWRWTADDGLGRELQEPARKAVTWLLNSMNSDKRGYVAYERRSPQGLENQGWKDSPDSALFRDGGKAKLPLSLCEVQGYTYDALLRTATLAENVWGDERFAARLRKEAEDLRCRFEKDFWIEGRGYYALALDGKGKQVDSLASNVGHLLWSGIVPEEKARTVADRLMGEGFFSGWGVRTMAAGEGGYDPESYHNGSVWPHDNALVAEGLRRYGFREEACRVAAALLEAAPHFGYRLPEVFAGHSREEVPEPVKLPLACSPQAWAAGTVPLLVRTLLGLEPDPGARNLRVDVRLPEGVESLRLDGVPAFGERFPVSV